jgi:drug/metabolite transporter (DMT)-like permease
MATVALAVNNTAVPFVYMHGGTSPALLLVRFSVLIAVMLVVLLALRIPMRLSGWQYADAAVAGAFSCLGALGTITAFGLIPVSLALLILYLYPIFTAILQGLIDRKPPSLGLLACLLVAFAGLAVALGIGGEFDRTLKITGLLSSFASAVCYSGYFVWSRLRLSTTEPGATMLITAVASAVVAAVAGLVLHSQGLMPFQLPADSTGWLAALLCSLAFSLASFGMFRSVQLIGSTPAAMLMNLETVFTMPLAVLFLSETLDARRLIGAALVIGAVVASQVLAAG